MADAKLILRPPHVAVRMKPGAWPDLPRMLRTLRDAGYTPIPEAVGLTLTGTLVRQAEGVALRVEGVRPDVVIPLQQRAGGDPGPAEASAGRRVEVTGNWKPAADAKGPGTLAVTGIRAPREPDPKERGERD